VSNLESILNSYTETNIENVKSYFGENEFDLEMQMLKSMSGKDKDASIKEIFNILKEVKNFDNFYKNILEYLRIGLQARFDDKLKLESLEILKLDSKNKILSEIIKDTPALFTSKNLLYFLEKGSLINKNSDKHMMSIAIFCSFLEI
jgi:DNA polymerase III gamma/tau subunit